MYRPCHSSRSFCNLAIASLTEASAFDVLRPGSTEINSLVVALVVGAAPEGVVLLTYNSSETINIDSF
jgi:hypothetical protein